MAQEQVTASAEGGKSSAWIDQEHYREIDGTIGTRTELTKEITGFLCSSNKKQRALFFDFCHAMAYGTEEHKSRLEKVVLELAARHDLL